MNKPWSERQKNMTREEIKENLQSRNKVEHVFDPETAQPKNHNMTNRGLWFTCDDCPLRIFNKKAARM